MEKIENFEEFVNEAKIMDMAKTAFTNIKSIFTNKVNAADYSLDYEKLRDNIINNPKKATLVKTHKEVEGLAADPKIWSKSKYETADFANVVEYTSRIKNFDFAVGILKNFTKQNKHLIDQNRSLEILKIWYAKWEKELELKDSK